jgi:putative ABC transport system permease protein
MDNLLQDIRFGVRMLRKNPDFTLAASLTLALGIGAATAVFSVVDAVLLRPLPYQEPERLVWIWEKPPKGLRGNVSTANFVDWRDRSEVFESMCAMAYTRFTHTGMEQPEQFSGSRVSVDFFDLLGTRPLLGRTFVPEEGEPGRDKVVVLSYGLWQSRFGSDRSLAGNSITLNGDSYKVVGILPPEFRFRNSDYQIWAPLALDRANLNRDFHYLKVVARLEREIGIEQARAEMEILATNIARANPEIEEGWSVHIEPIQAWLVGPQLRVSLVVLFGAVGFLFLIACVNVSNLLLARSNSRQREIALRASLGAGRTRLIRQLLTESLLLAGLGGALGVTLGFGFVKAFPSIFPSVSLPAAATLAMDGRVFTFTLAAAFLTSVLFGLAPAWQASHTRPAGVLREGGRSSAGGMKGRRFRRTLVAVEVALALVLLTGAVLMMRSLIGLYDVDPGVRTQNVLTMDITLPETQYSDASRVNRFFREALERIEALPGVRSAGITTTLPLQGSRLALPVEIGGETSSAPNFQRVSPGYFSTMGMGLLEGRLFTMSDNEGAARVAIVNKRFVRQFIPGGKPLGTTFKTPNLVPNKRSLGPDVEWVIVGVVRNVRVFGLLDDRSAEVYLPYPHSPPTSTALAVHTEIEPENLEQQVRNAILSVDKDQPVMNVATMETIVARSASQPKLRSLLLGLFASLALLLAAIGIYGVMSYSVAERTHEIGIRVALGARRGEILGSVLRQALCTAALGAGMGVVASFGLTRLISSALYGVTATDPTTYILVVTILTFVSALAGTVPAYRASRVDPIVALRYE